MSSNLEFEQFRQTDPKRFGKLFAVFFLFGCITLLFSGCAELLQVLDGSYQYGYQQPQRLVNFTSVPEGAEIWISDGLRSLRLGRTPIQLPLPETYQLTGVLFTAQLDDGRRQDRAITVPPWPPTMHFYFGQASYSTPPVSASPNGPIPSWEKSEILVLPKRPVWGTWLMSSEDVLEMVAKSVVMIQAGSGHGSGFFVTSDGLILTNFHVIKNASDITVETYNGRKLTASLLRADPVGDLALLDIHGDGYAPATLSDSGRKVKPGSEVYAIGAPLSPGLAHSISKGVVSGIRPYEHYTYIQTDLAINPGNSGGPLLDRGGQVLGVVSLKATGEGIEGVGFAISVDDVKRELGLKHPGPFSWQVRRSAQKPLKEPQKTIPSSGAALKQAEPKKYMQCPVGKEFYNEDAKTCPIHKVELHRWRQK